MKRSSSILDLHSLGLLCIATIGSLGLFASIAQALTDEVILRKGQVLPGDPNQQPVFEILDFGIDSQQNVAVIAENATYTPPYAYGSQFKGIYRLVPGQSAQLIEGGQSQFAPYGNNTSVYFRLPSISLGKVGYFRSSTAKYVRGEKLQFGIPGAVQTIAEVPISPFNGPEPFATNAVATVNGKLFFFSKPDPQANRTNDGIIQYQNGQYQTLIASNNAVITAGGNPPLNPNSDSDFILRATSEILVFSRTIVNAAGKKVTQVFEQPNGKALRKVYESTGNLCGLAASRSNIVICLDGEILARRGKTTQFTPIVTPAPFTKFRDQPSISNETVVFVERLSVPNALFGGEMIYLSRPNQPLQTLASLPASSVGVPGALQLSANGQSINGSAVVYRYKKTDGSVELRRIKLQ